VEVLAALERDGTPRIVVRADERQPARTELRFYLPGGPLLLSEFMPVLEDFGLRALAEDQIVVTPAGGPPCAMQSFFVQDRRGRPLAIEAVGPRLTDALLAVHGRRVVSDALDRLVVEAGLDWRAVDCLRAYRATRSRSGSARGRS
jgi:glutamate dehydrogenase